MPPAKSAKKGNFVKKTAEIRKCNDLRVRIKTFCKLERITQAQLANNMNVSAQQMQSFMSGNALTGSEVYAQGLKYLKVRMPLPTTNGLCRSAVRERLLPHLCWQLMISE
jgi:transcriptional regulator with XRE-family HTH domain